MFFFTFRYLFWVFVLCVTTSVCNHILGSSHLGWGFHLMFIPGEVNYSYNCEQQDVVLLPIHSQTQTMRLVSVPL